MALDDNAHLANYRDEANNYPLLNVAVRKEPNDHELAPLLIRKGADVDMRDERGLTPLFHAAVLQRYKIMGVLLYAGADIFAFRKIVARAYHPPAREAGRAIIARLLTIGAPPVEDAYRLAILYDDRAMVRLFEECGATLSEEDKPLFCQALDNYWSSIDRPTSAGRLAFLNMALERTDPNGEYRETEFTVLAIRGNHSYALRRLLEMGARRDNLLVKAVLLKRYGCVRVLVQAGSSPDKEARNGLTALDLARGDKRMLACLGVEA